MQFTALLPLLAILVCPIVMGIMMWNMNKNMDAHQGHSMPGKISDEERLQALREQRHQLEQEINEVEKIAALNAKKESVRLASSVAKETQPQPLKAKS